jgi:hypothetical protein
LKLRFHLPDQPLDIGGRHGPFGTRNADAACQFFSVELFAGAILLDDQWGCQDRALVRAEALSALETFATAANAAMAVVRGIQDFRIVMLAVWAPHE